ncbi:hypothetical protein FF1_016892 [Malus domestica]
MAEEEVVVAAESPMPSDHKRKLEDLEPKAAPEIVELDSNGPDDANAEPDCTEEVDVSPSDESEAKRPRLDDKPDGIASENGHQEEKVDEPKKENEDQPSVDSGDLEVPQPASVEVTEAVTDEQKSEVNELQNGMNSEPSDTQNHAENSVAEKAEEPSQGESQPHYAEEPQQGDAYSAQQEQPSVSETVTHKMEVPNNKVGVLIGKSGDTIRYLQYNSGAKIQITRDSDADPYSATRPVEIIGTLDNISKAEKLINAVIAEADAGGSPSLVARGVATALAVAAAEQIQIQVPNEKVGLIIGRGGETIKGLQTRSGARIQVLIPQHLPEGDESKERTVRVTGDKKQIEVARELIKEVMNQTVRPSALSSGFNHQGYRPHGPGGSQWAPRGPHLPQPSSYDYPQRGPYPSHNPQYPPAYGGYPQHMGPRSGYGSGWEQRPPSSMPHGGGYNYYGGQVADAPVSAQHSAPVPSHAPGPSPNPAMGAPSQANYNYGQPHGPDYGHPAPYSQAAPPQHNYGHGYEEPKYDNHAPTQHPYAGYAPSQQYPQTGAHPGYGPQQHYSKPPPYGMPSQAPTPQSYGPPRANQPGDAVYQGSAPPHSYGPNVLAQQSYPYASSGPAQQTYPAYGSAPAADGYSQPPPASGLGYPQQGGQPVSYGQPGAQQAAGSYGQAAPTAGYAQYPSSQQGYAEQAAPNAAGYGYQGSQDPGYGAAPAASYGAPAAAQPGYTQPASQQNYDQSIPQSAGYGAAPPAASAGYGKTVSPQPGYPQYDSSQMYAAAPR